MAVPIFPLAVASRAALIATCGPHCSGFPCRGVRALGSRASVVLAHRLTALWHVGLSRAPCIGRQVLNHWATREAPFVYSLE